MKRVMEVIDKYLITNEDLEYIQLHELVESCTYEGLEQGHGGNYLYHVKLYGDDTIYSVTIEN